MSIQSLNYASIEASEFVAKELQEALEHPDTKTRSLAQSVYSPRPAGLCSSQLLSHTAQAELSKLKTHTPLTTFTTRTVQEACTGDEELADYVCITDDQEMIQCPSVKQINRQREKILSLCLELPETLGYFRDVHSPARSQLLDRLRSRSVLEEVTVGHLSIEITQVEEILSSCNKTTDPTAPRLLQIKKELLEASSKLESWLTSQSEIATEHPEFISRLKRVIQQIKNQTS